MKKTIPEKPFGFADELLTLRGEVATQGERPKLPGKDATGEMFTDALAIQKGKDAYRAELS